MRIISGLKLGIGRAALKLAAGTLGDVAAKEVESFGSKLVPEGSRKNAPQRGTKELLQAYDEMPWLRSVVNKVSKSFSSVAWRAFVVRQKDTGKAINISKMGYVDFRARQKILGEYRSSKEFEVEEIERHPILSFLDSANMFFPGVVSRQLTQQYLDLVGESFWVLERDGLNKPTSYFPIPPTWISQTPTLKDGAFTFRGPGGQEFNLPASMVIWFYEPKPSDPYSRGSGMARALADELDTDEYAAKYTKTRFINNARPDLLISAAGLQKEDTERLEQNWNSNLQGFANAMKAHFLNKEVKVTDLSPKFSELQLIELRKHERDTVFHVYGVPPELFGVNESSNRATIESAEFLYAKHVLLPRLEFHRSILQWKLVPEFDERIILEYESPIEEDADRELSAAEKAPWALTVNEWRDKAGVDPLEDEKGDVHMVPLNLTPVDDISLSDTGDSETPPQEEIDEDEDEEEAKAIIVQVVESDSSKMPELDSALLEELEGDPLRSVQILDNGTVRTATWKTVENKLHDIVLEFGAETVSEVGEEIAFQETERVLDYVRRNGVLRSALYDRTTQNGIAKELVEGIRNKENVSQLSNRIESLYADYVQNRAKTIARTESLRAANFGAEEGMKQAGVTTKEWLTTRDAFVRDSHTALDSVVASVDGLFTIPNGSHAGATTNFPGNFGVAELDINCRCTIIPVFSEERDYLDTESKREKRWKIFEASRVVQERELRRIVRASLNRQKQYVLTILNGGNI